MTTKFFNTRNLKVISSSDRLRGTRVETNLCIVKINNTYNTNISSTINSCKITNLSFNLYNFRLCNIQSLFLAFWWSFQDLLVRLSFNPYIRNLGFKLYLVPTFWFLNLYVYFDILHCLIPRDSSNNFKIVSTLRWVSSFLSQIFNLESLQVDISTIFCIITSLLNLLCPSFWFHFLGHDM